jgi:YbgC/YbaW family acyl-CoA thioester hydrolase
MSRTKLDMPENFIFSTSIDVRITDINYGNHLGNDSLLSIIHEARMRFLNSLGYSEIDVEGAGIMMADVVIIYKSQSFYGDRLKIEINVADISRKSCDLCYRITKKEDKIVALAKTAIVFFDYQQQKPVRIPEGFISKVGD